MQENKVLTERPKPGQDWKTARGYTVRINASKDDNVIEAHFMDIKIGGNLPVQFDLDGKKIGGREDWLVERVK